MKSFRDLLSIPRRPKPSSQVPSKDSQNHDAQPTKTWTYRIQGVPLKWGQSELEQFLGATGNSSARLEVKSLVADVQGNRQTATVDCPRGVKFPPTISASLEPSSTPGSNLAILTCDSHFHGLTALFCPPKEDHLVEYVSSPPDV